MKPEEDAKINNYERPDQQTGIREALNEKEQVVDVLEELIMEHCRFS